MPVVDACGGSFPDTTVIVSWVKPAPSTLPSMLVVMNESSILPRTTGRAFRPTYVAWETAPGSDHSRLTGSMIGRPGRAPGTFTCTSLALMAFRYRP